MSQRKNPILRWYLCFGCLAFLLLLPPMAQTCLPDFPRVVFTRQSGPDEPMTAFVKGRIGVPLPTWRRVFLIVAYRYLNNKPLTASEQRSFVDFWGSNANSSDEPDEAEVKQWQKDPTRYYGGEPPVIHTYRIDDLHKESPYASFENCLPPAFENATHTLRLRAKAFGPKSAELRQWIEAQDRVFFNCDGGTFLPEPLPASANQLLRADRAYQ